MSTKSVVLNAILHDADLAVLDHFLSTYLNSLDILYSSCSRINCQGVSSITVVGSIEVESSLCIANYVNRRSCCTAADSSCTKTIVWEVPEWSHTRECTVSVSKLEESVRSRKAMSIVSSHHQEEVLLTYLELNKTVEVSVHSDGITIIVPNIHTSRNVDEVVEQLVDEGESTYSDLLLSQTRSSQSVLRAIAAERVVKEISAKDLIDKYRLPVGSTIRSLVRELLNRNLIYKSAEGYSIYDQLFAEWLRK